MISIVLVIHVLLSLAIIALIMLQRGKGADAGASLGGGSSGTVFGARGAANFLSRTTAILSTAFFVTSLTLAYLSSNLESATSTADESVLLAPSDVPAASDVMPSDIPAAVEEPASDIPASE